MKRFLLIILCGAALFSARPSQAAVYVSAGITVGQPVQRVVFRERLAPYGRWVRTAAYGEVWVPAGVAVGWRPYWDGRWVLTEYGWTFVSDDPWGWATWHYGNWVMADGVGWVWVPGETWAPAWVSWRYGGGYAAWAPLPPVWVHTTYVYSSPAWVVVSERHFTRPIATVAVSANASIWQSTVPISRPVQAGSLAVNAGPRPQAIAQAVGHPVQPVAASAVVGHGTSSIARAPRAPSAPPAVRQRLAQHWQRPAAGAGPRAMTGDPAQRRMSQPGYAKPRPQQRRVAAAPRWSPPPRRRGRR